MNNDQPREEARTAYYTGTFKDFVKFIGPRSRNVVQNLTRSYKGQIQKCQDCGESPNSLEAAHLRGRDRKSLMRVACRKACEECFEEEFLVNLDLKKFEEEYKKLHYPLEESFMILCRECHTKYDRG